ncbi:MAG: Gfo/Idh/MocA family oxidoreductase, partial [Leeuwenhoekiella sp.]
MIKAGVLGAGHLGKIHLKLLNQSTKFDLVGFYDEAPGATEAIIKEFGYTSFKSMNDLIAACEMVVIVTPTSRHYDCAEAVIKAGKHLFIEKPIAETFEEGTMLQKLAEKHKVMGQVGHVERFNPAFLAVNEVIDNPMFIEAHRLSEFNPRGTDVPVVLDLMIHDIDAILSVVKSKVKHVSASGVAVISDTPDIANARIEFENGCVANLTASRIS